MKNNKTITIAIVGLILIAGIVAGIVFTPKNANNSQSKTSESGSNPLLEMVKGKGEPKLDIIEDIDTSRHTISGQPLPEDALFWAEKDYREEDGKSIWTYTRKGVVGELVSSDRKSIDEFSYTFDIDIENKIASRGDIKRI